MINLMEQSGKCAPENERPEFKLAREKLLRRLRNIAQDMSIITKQDEKEPQVWSEKQVEKLLSLPRPQASSNLMGALLAGVKKPKEEK